MLVALVQAVLMALLVPPWMGEDEPWHFEYAAHIAAGERPVPSLVPATSLEPSALDRPVSHTMLRLRFPRAEAAAVAALEERLLDSMARHGFERKVDWAPDLRGTTSFDALQGAITAAQQPPLYFVLLGLWLAPVQALALEWQLAWARIPSALAYLLAVWTALRLGQVIARDRRVAVLAGLGCALWPMHARQAAIVNNDVLAKAFVCFALLLALNLARWRARSWPRVRFLIVLAVAPFAKGTAVSAFALAPLVATRGVEDRESRRRLALVVSLAGLVLAAGFGFALTDSPILPMGIGDLLRRLQIGWGVDRLGNLGRTIVGMFGWYHRPLPEWIYDLAAWIVAVAALGWVSTFLRASALSAVARFRSVLDPAAQSERLNAESALARPRAGTLLVLVCALITLQFALVALRGVTAGRYLFPAIAPMAVLIAIGWMGLTARRGRGALAACLVVALLLLNVAFIVLGLVGEEWLRRGA